ncbi:unnamed protein product [Vitrella brassicaformis CCMP3155]|uniref:ETFB lysine methyltransferase n=2 Tax=Vitrella brassicaformis TaxID=1169539 RepID=A0A0G4EHK7_VITBC|nr:unnamed protein product [Vitrella brassicaformis CCMP3155]|eukprot:CEL95384.1 unnamed protein product [Vitrella brassicaformis CCMP3155]
MAGCFSHSSVASLFRLGALYNTIWLVFAPSVVSLFVRVHFCHHFLGSVQIYPIVMIVASGPLLFFVAAAHHQHDAFIPLAQPLTSSQRIRQPRKQRLIDRALPRLSSIAAASADESAFEVAAKTDHFRVLIVPSEAPSSDVPVPLGGQLQDIHLRLHDGWGTGAHPSTRLCMEFLERRVRRGDAVLDYGVGSAILSVAAAKLGASHVLGVDIDDDILTNARENCRLNGVDGCVELMHTREVVTGDTAISGRFDGCVANILVGPLKRLAPALGDAVRADGWLCLSGVRPSQVDDVMQAYNVFYDFDHKAVRTGVHDVYGEWACVVGRRRERGEGEAREREYMSDLAVS